MTANSKALEPPPGLLLAAFCLWSWQTGFWPIGIALGLGLETHRYSAWRWDLDKADIRRVWDLCVVLTLGLGIWVFVANDGAGIIGSVLDRGPVGYGSDEVAKSRRSLLAFFRWLPLVFAPLVLAQLWGILAGIPFSSISWVARRRLEAAGSTDSAPKGSGRTVLLHNQPLADPLLNIAYPYFALILIASGASGTAGAAFFWLSATLVAIALIRFRSPRFGLTVWVGAIGVVAIGGYLAQAGVRRGNQALQELRFEWLQWLSRGETDAFKSRSAIGRIGEIKLSNRIVIRVEPQQGAPPALLREATYNQFKSPTWYNLRKVAEPLNPEADGTTWIIGGVERAQGRIRVSQYLPGRSGLLAVPPGVLLVSNLPAVTVAKSAPGALRVSEGPGLVRFEAVHGMASALDSAPEQPEAMQVIERSPPIRIANNSVAFSIAPNAKSGIRTISPDLQIPEAEMPAVARVGSELGFGTNSIAEPKEVLRQLDRFFGERFSYSTYQSASLKTLTNQTPIGNFLERTRSGHCEYFAAATVFLLRHHGIPARYAVGYAVQEKSGNRYLIRERHAHAWALGFIDGAWRDIDFTPASWATEESKNTPFWQPLADWIAELKFQIAWLRWGQTLNQSYLLAPVLLLAGVLAFRIVTRRGARRNPEASAKPFDRASRPGWDSEYYPLEAMLARRGWQRRAEETQKEWWRRIGPSSGLDAESFGTALELHYRLRFDPKGIVPAEREQLRRLAADCRDPVRRN